MTKVLGTSGFVGLLLLSPTTGRVVEQESLYGTSPRCFMERSDSSQRRTSFSDAKFKYFLALLFVAKPYLQQLIWFLDLPAILGFQIFKDCSKKFLLFSFGGKVRSIHFVVALDDVDKFLV